MCACVANPSELLQSMKSVAFIFLFLQFVSETNDVKNLCKEQD